MAMITNFGFLARLRSDAASHVISYANGQTRRSGRGLSFWFLPYKASIAELPMDDRELTLFVKGRSRDFQALSLQGALTWRIVDPDRLAERIDFTIALDGGGHRGEPLEQIKARIAGLANQAALQYLADGAVGDLLAAGLEPPRLRLTEALAGDPSLAEMGVGVAAVRLTSLAPSSELERALQAPTFESLQQKADQATFARRALAVDKERAIAENELANKVELARRETGLIAQEAENAGSRARGVAEARQIEAAAEAERIRALEGARVETETARLEIYRDLPAAVLYGLAARELAGKLTKIDHVNVTPDLIASLLGEIRAAAPAAPAK
ncbi:MAG: SPFH domain-containing protein [Roseiarcus sp.]|jgi:regulator of protease activity HflC (stomatin/prohibitin superfamily)